MEEHAADNEATIASVSVGNGKIAVVLANGERISAPLSLYPRLLHASPEQLRAWVPCAGGEGIHWPQLDEDISISGLKRQTPAASGHPFYPRNGMT